MGFLDFFFRQTRPRADFLDKSYNNLTVPFDGEKTPYELGEPVNKFPDFYGMRLRAWKSFLDTDIVQNAVKKYVLWIVGAGLKIQSEPIKDFVQGNSDEFKRRVESNFRLFCNIKAATYDETMSINDLASEALKTAILSGDVLCVARYNRGRISFQAIDGGLVRNPLLSNTDYFKQAEKRGNTIISGVERNARGVIVAFYVYQRPGEFKRIRARNTSGTVVYAWLMRGSYFKLHSVRGLSLLAAVLSSAQKLDRYKEATIGNAEENAKIPFTIEHSKDSDGENPLIGQLAQSLGKGHGTAPETGDFEACDAVATKIAQTTEKQVYNMPVGSTLKRNYATIETDFGSFFDVNINVIYATLGIPPEVAMDKFGGAYSGSRAALKSWEYKMLVDRTRILKNQFYKPLFDFWLNIQILENKIQAPGYLQAFAVNDFMTLEAYRNCRFIGASIPHIDPVKEVSAERLKLGGNFKDVPLTTVEQSCESLNSGDFDALLEKAREEKKKAGDFEIKQI